jgi:site-specific recombinase XerD
MYLSKNKKSGIYYIYFRKDDGKKTRASTGTTFKKEALKFLSTFEKELKNRKRSNIISLGELRKKYLASIEATHTKGSYRHSRKCIERLIEYLGEGINVNDITKQQVETFINNIYKTSQHTASLHLRHLKAIFNKAIDWNYLEKNPFKGIRLRIATNNPIFISKDELKLIVEEENNSILSSIYSFAFYTGLRLSEITNLEWNDVDLNSRIINLKNKEGFTTKSKKERAIPISNVVYDILINLDHNSNYVFTKDEFKFNATYVSKSFKKCVIASNLNSKIHFHTLRHSFASNLVQRGANIYTIQKLLGHSNISTTQIYSHLNQGNLISAVDLLND